MRNYWWLNINPRILRFRDFDKGDVFTYSAKNEDGSYRKVYSNFLEAKKGEIVLIYETIPIGRLIGICTIERELEDDLLHLKKIESFPENVANIFLFPIIASFKYFSISTPQLYLKSVFLNL